MFLTHIEATLSHQLNAVSSKSLENQASCIVKQRNRFELKICLYKGFKVLSYHMKVELKAIGF